MNGGRALAEGRGTAERASEPTFEPTFEDFFFEQHDRLYRALFFVTGDASEAEDIAQDAFLRLWERWDDVGGIDDPVAYLFKVAMNGFRMRLRRARVAARHLVQPTLPADVFHEVELREDLRQLLASLPVRQRAALVLTEILGYDAAKAGEILGARPSTVRSLANRGRAALRAT
jgi:RNA polymerase sigma factor, sigma-70 family